MVEQRKLDDAKDLVDTEVALAKDVSDTEIADAKSVVDEKLDLIMDRLDLQHNEIRQTNELLHSMRDFLDRIKDYFTK